MSKETVDFITEKILRYKGYVEDRLIKLSDSKKYCESLESEIKDFEESIKLLEEDLNKISI